MKNSFFVQWNNVLSRGSVMFHLLINWKPFMMLPPLLLWMALWWTSASKRLFSQCVFPTLQYISNSGLVGAHGNFMLLSEELASCVQLHHSVSVPGECQHPPFGKQTNKASPSGRCNVAFTDWRFSEDQRYGPFTYVPRRKGDRKTLSLQLPSVFETE